MSQIVTELNNLGLDFLNHRWVQATYDAEFLEFDDLPPDYENFIESLHLRSILTDIVKAIDVWIHPEVETTEERSWAILSQQIDHKKVLAILAYYIDNGCKNLQNSDFRNYALLASRVYYKLLSIPGYKAYDIYHSQLFVHSLACLSFPKTMCDENNYFNNKELTYEVNSIIKELSPFVLDLRVVVQNLQLTPGDMNFEDILSNLLDITGGAIVNKLHIDKIELTKLSGVIYEIIDMLINHTNNEPDAVAIRLLFKCLLPKLVAASTDTRNANNIVRASYVTYSGLLLTKYGKEALTGYTLLLQHLCYSQDGLERYDVRNARVSLVSGLMSLLPRKSYRKTVKWLLKLSTTSKVPHRQIAIELLAKLLNNEPEAPKPPKPTRNNETGDSGLGIDAEQSDIRNDGTAEEAQLENVQNKTPPSTEDESSQDSQVLPVPPDKDDTEIMEDIMAGLCRQRPHTAPHGQILLAVYDRVNDTSSSLRSRAITILTECLNNTRPAIVEAIKELNGDSEVSRLMAVGARSVCDERAAVRRAGAALVQRLLGVTNYVPHATDLAILVTQCRDASLIVRLSAITALADLVEKRPSDAVIDAFLTGPMHQLSDPEPKVQVQVINYVQNLLLERLKVFAGREYEDPIPWLVLAGITRRNMKKHLQKVCTIISKGGKYINHRLVDILSSHLDVLDDERDLYCLLMMACVSRLVDYHNVGFVFNYYYKISDNDEVRDSRLMSLTLELGVSWCRFAHLTECIALRDHLVRRLADSTNDGCRIARATLAACLDPENLSWATELMQQSEYRALKTRDIEEAVRAADLSLIAPDPPSPNLLNFFLNMLVYPPPGWSNATFGTCVAGAGRLCVRAREAAVVAAPVLASLLPADAAPMQARVNSLLALTDICIRYASIVDPLLELVCGCLSLDSPTELRRATARALTRLLLGGFLRLRAPLYYRYCALLADEDHGVREPAEYFVTSCLGVETIYNHFVDSVKYYNKASSEKISFDSRQLIYDVMLQRLTLVQVLNVQCRLARDVLKHAADLADESDDELPPELNAELLDAITLLCGPRMRLPKKQNTNEPADIAELTERVTTNIVSHKMKRTVAEVLVPAVLRLYARMRMRGGQLAAYLVRIATDLLIDYRQEIEELIDSDEELVGRIQQFQENIGQAPTFGNPRNLVTTSAPPEPETPRASRRRPRLTQAHTPRKRALRI